MGTIVNSPDRSLIKNNNAAVLERSIQLGQKRRNIRNSLKWGIFNVTLLLLLLYHISTNSCHFQWTYSDYFEYFLISVLAVNVVYHMGRIIVSTMKLEQNIVVTKIQKKLLGIADSDPNYKIVDTPKPSIKSIEPNLSDNNITPMNVTALSWRSNLSQLTNDNSLNYSMSSPSWIYHHGRNSSSPTSSFNHHSAIINDHNISGTQRFGTPRDTSGIDFISDADELDQYLKDYETNSQTPNTHNNHNIINNNSFGGGNNQSQLFNQSTTGTTTNLLSSFWSHPVTKTAKDMSMFLKNCRYQLSIQSPSTIIKSSAITNKNNSPNSINNNLNKNDDKSPINAQTSALVAWTRMNVDIVVLTKWNENLRQYISRTILERLVKEFDNINESLDKQGLSDIKIGHVGLDRLRKTAQIPHITQFIPSLTTIIPFLETTSNQEYLVKRIKELNKGGCMSEFRWNSGSTNYNGKDWDESLPTDSDIIMHLFASYLDTQLMPLPNQPDMKPFTGSHYIKYKEKLPTLSASTSLIIQQVADKPPYYRVIVGETVYEMVKGYSNLFHCILFFLYNVNKREHGMLGRVNLGRGGVNMLWIIDQ